VKTQHGNHSNSLQMFWEIVRQKTIAIWWLILYNPTKPLASDGSVESDVLSHLTHKTLSVVHHKRMVLHSQRWSCARGCVALRSLCHCKPYTVFLWPHVFSNFIHLNIFILGAIYDFFWAIMAQVSDSNRLHPHACHTSLTVHILSFGCS